MYTIKETANIIGVSSSTLRRWEKEGKITSTRTFRRAQEIHNRRFI
ncbi:MerR family DNA-binding transcriptional regulator [Anaerobacillus alkalidiazotrophicus]